MSAAAITQRLRRVAELSDLRTRSRLHPKLDMSPAGITRRLREVEQLRRLCLRLGTLRPS